MDESGRYVEEKREKRRREEMGEGMDESGLYVQA